MGNCKRGLAKISDQICMKFWFWWQIFQKIHCRSVAFDWHVNLPTSQALLHGTTSNFGCSRSPRACRRWRDEAFLGSNRTEWIQRGSRSRRRSPDSMIRRHLPNSWAYFQTRQSTGTLRCIDTVGVKDIFKAILTLIILMGTIHIWRPLKLYIECTGWFICSELGSLWFWLFHCLPSSAWADGNLAEAAGQDGGTPKSKSTQPRSQNRWTTLYFSIPLLRGRYIWMTLSSSWFASPLHTDLPLQFATQPLEYVLPSLPHTGLYTAGQTQPRWGAGSGAGFGAGSGRAMQAWAMARAQMTVVARTILTILLSSIFFRCRLSQILWSTVHTGHWLRVEFD